jgi:hypothetical protein
MITIKEGQILKSRFFSTLFNLIAKSSFHGISNIARAKLRFSKYLWLFFTLISIAACSYYLISIINHYSIFNYVTKGVYDNEQGRQREKFYGFSIFSLHAYNAKG